MKNKGNDNKLLKEFGTLIKELSSSNDNFNPSFNKEEHESNSRLIITKLFLTWYFILIFGFFVFSLIYNLLSILLGSTNLLDIYKTVTIITTSLSGGVGFVIGYYFKNKN